MASAATDMLKPHQDDHESYGDDELSDRDPTSYDYYDTSEYPTIFSGHNTTQKLPISNDPDLPDFRQEYPEVFPDTIPMKLPTLRPGLNHTIPLIENKKDDFRNEYRRIPDHRIAQLRKWLSKWEAAGIAKRGPARFATPIFGVAKKQPGDIRWVMDLKARNQITRKDFTPIPTQETISDDHGSNRGGSAVSLGIFPKTPRKLPGQLSI